MLPHGRVCKGILHAIAGDSLGSHNIGGFLENLSLSLNFCRYCEINTNTFQADPLFEVQIGDKIKSPGEDQAWQLVLQLIEMVSPICAPAISTGQIAYSLSLIHI